MSNDLFFYLFNNFIGGADDEEMSMNYLNLDLNNNNSLRKFLQDEIIPFMKLIFFDSERRFRNSFRKVGKW